MVDCNATATIRLRTNHKSIKLTTTQAQKLESMMARTYADDVDARPGTLGVPRSYNRPGQRDDEVHCTHVSALNV